MIWTHLLEHLGVPAGVAVVVGVGAMVLQRSMGGKSGSVRGGRRQRPPRR